MRVNAAIHGRPEQIPAAERIRFSVFGALCFLVGASEGYKFNLVGEIYLAELLLPVLALLSLGVRKTAPRSAGSDAPLLIGALLVTFAGYVLSDLLRDASMDEFMKGWGRVLLVLSNLVSMIAICNRDKRYLWWLVLGMGVGGVLWFRFIEHLPISLWKFGYSRPMTLAAAALAWFMPARIAALMFGVLAIMSMIWDFRMHSAVCMAIAGVLWIKASPGSGGVISGRRFLQLGIAAVVVMGAVYGLLKWTESDFHKQRRGSSSFGREIGLKTGVRAIMNSPFVGYGSWGRNSEIAAIETAVANEDPENMKRYGANFKPNGTSLAPHSQFLQAWMEGGILGAAFFLVLGARLLRHARFLILRRKQDALAAILYFTVFYGLWNLINSPFSAPHRVNIALAACAAVVLSVEAAAASRQNGGGRIFRPLATLPLRPQLTANHTVKRRHP